MSTFKHSDKAKLRTATSESSSTSHDVKTSPLTSPALSGDGTFVFPEARDDEDEEDDDDPPVVFNLGIIVVVVVVVVRVVVIVVAGTVK